MEALPTMPKKERAKLTLAQKRQLFRDLEKVDPRFTARIMPFLEGLYKYYFRCDVDGWENVPEEKVMFIGNHNGLLTFEVLMMFYAWWERFHGARRALGLAHVVALENPFFRWIIPKLGAIPASPELALEALKRDYSLLVYPGGEKEAFRPFKDRKKIDFFQRKGFIRIALEAKVPIVPVVSIGAHETYVIFDRGEEIAEKLGLTKRMRLHGVPITARGVFFAWCVFSGIFTFFPLLIAPAALLWTFIPLPAKMTFKILAPGDVAAMVDPALSEDENLQRIYDHVTLLIQSTLTEEYAKRKYPIIG
jgi:1-acyl-sn-glycerol-3-phosphate acyltransferase